MERAFDIALRFLRDQPVTVIAALAAILSMFFVWPNPGYAGYIDWRVLGLLFCLMLCSAGLQEAGVFAWVGRKLLSGSRPRRLISLLLVLLCFFVSMLVTNDVALIMFVPFTMFLFTVSGQTSRIGLVVVLQTVAANLGSMVTPMGNPQNLFLYTHYGVALGDFVACIFPFAALSLVLLIVCTLAFAGSGTMTARFADRNGSQVDIESDNPGASDASSGTSPSNPATSASLEAEIALSRRRTCMFGALFVLAVLSVVDIIPLPITFATTLVAAALFSRATIKKVDYALLVTFACFFVFSGNLANIGPIRDVLVSLMGQAPFAVSLVASQVISNVPSAILLAPFTDTWQQLMLGVDIGGLGTPVASLASLISLEFYRHARIGSLRRYLALFFAINIAFLIANIAFALLIGAI